MSDRIGPKLSKWPFYLGDALLVAAAGYICWQGPTPLGLRALALVVLSVAGAAALGILPFLLEYRALVKLVEASALTDVVSQIQNIEQLAGQVRSATGQWQNVQDAADKTTAAAREIAERMTAEVKAFTEFMQRANDSEKANLRLEVDKLRRAEADWLQVLIRVLDHVYALHLGAVRSGQPNLIEQMGNFQNACRDAARRVGLAPFIAALDEPFDGQRHQLVEGTKPAPDAVVGETLAAGYTFQSRLLRPALVRLQTTPPPDGGNEDALPEPEPVPDGSQSQLPLEPSANASPS